MENLTFDHGVVKESVIGRNRYGRQSHESKGTRKEKSSGTEEQDEENKLSR